MNQLITNRLRHLFVPQQDASDCGIACLSTIVLFFNGEVGSKERLREISGTSKTGTTMLGLMQACETIGLNAVPYEAEIESLKVSDFPSILHVIIDDRLLHYIVCLGYDKEKSQFILSDPARGIVRLSDAELNAIWKSKALLLIEGIKPYFITRSQNRNQQFRWVRHLIQEDSNLLLVALILGIAVAILGLSTAIFSQRLLDDILPAKDKLRLIAGLSLLAFLLLAKSGLGFLRQLVMIRQGYAFNIRMIRSFLGLLLFLPQSFFDNRKTGDLIARMNDTSRIQRVLSSLISNVLIDVILLIATGIAIFMFDPQIALLTFLVYPIFIGIVMVYKRPLLSAQHSVMSAYAHNESNYINIIQGVSEIKLANKESIFRQYTQAIYTHFQGQLAALGKLGATLGLKIELFEQIILIAVLFWSSWNVLEGHTSIGTLMAVLQMTGMILASTNRLAITYIQVQEARVAFERMSEFASIEPEKRFPDERTVTDSDNTLMFKSLQMCDVSFRFPGRSSLFDEVNLEVHKGEMIALVGESGSGKTLLFKLIQRLYNPESGKIFVNDMDLNSYDLTGWRSILGVVPQDISLFNGTVWDNILLGDDPNDSDVVKRLEQLGSYGFDTQISKFPQGYATQIGEDKVHLSGGQKQILALARALYRRPQLLLLDEATSALDGKTECFVFDLLQRLKKEMGIIILTHRTNTVQEADRIYLLENKKVKLGESLKMPSLSKQIFS